jgi:predicted alpha/beta-hydrolase family hydrolase
VAAVVVPGYGASPEQPIVKAMAARLEAAGIEALPIGFTRKKPTEPFAQEIDELRHARDALAAESVVLVGRSFGGRICARVAASEPPAALVLLGHPIAPEGGRPRLEDEAALASVTCPTLVVQGDHDRLGPLDVLRRIASVNQHVEIYILKGVGHSFGPRQGEGLQYATEWLLHKVVAA